MSASGEAGVKSAPQKALTLHDHIKELRTRMLFVAIIFMIASSLAYSYRDPLVKFLLQPLEGEKLVYLNPGGGFSFIFSVSMYVGIAFAVPFLIYNLYRFVKPALPKVAQRGSALVLLASFLLLIGGISFGYIYAIPGALRFLTEFAGDYITASLTADSYLNFVLAYTAGLGILFQLPLILLFVHWIHPLKPSGLLKFERFAVVIAFVLAALITPTPDVVNQLVIAAPIILMYQIGFIAILVSISRQKRAAKRQLHKDAKSLPTVANELDDLLPVHAELKPSLLESIERAQNSYGEVASQPVIPAQVSPVALKPAAAHAPRPVKVQPRHAQRRVVSDIVRPQVRRPMLSDMLPASPSVHATTPTTQTAQQASAKPIRAYSVDGISFSS